ncbi:MASE1 domain-containing protein [Streptomyces sp. ATE26]|uniref:MASE1 domain-containing protein n=1 Tax=unclassified Streptomyces TaxID=2593676 RepID=UPI00116E7BF2|nr:MULTISPECIES: MASE1 domain-containing protein [unclassified Streptomyces]MDI1456976.1 MASE1 domain-containing protein [Streptomyces sp. ATE26]GEK02275.1 membrane protein [Streptomyces sp. 1-11]
MSVAWRERLRSGGSTALEVCVVAALYYGSARLGLLQELVRGQVTPVWPPSGIAVAALLLRGPRVWPGITLGAFLVNITLGPSVPAVLAITAGNTLAPLCSYALLRRTGFREELDRLRDALALIFLGAFTGMLISSTTGTAALVISGALAPDRFWPTWTVWWTGDATGVLVVTPVLLVLARAHRPGDVAPVRWAEGLLLAVATVCVGFLEAGRAPLLFLAFPLLFWAAFRFRLAGAAPCALAVSAFAIVAAARRSGPFAGHDLVTRMITLQAFNGSAALTALLLAAVLGERAESQLEIERACRQLASMVAEITTGDHHALHARGPDGAAGEDTGKDDGAGAGEPRSEERRAEERRTRQRPSPHR